jgi:hypothetical protein
MIAYGTLSGDMCLGALGLIDGSLHKERACMSHATPLNACGCSRDEKRKLLSVEALRDVAWF